MKLRCAVGCSLVPDGLEALRAACRDAVDGAGGVDDVRAILLLLSPVYGLAKLADAVGTLRAELTESVLLCGSTVGGFSYRDVTVDAFMGGQLGVLAIAFAGVPMACYYAPSVASGGDELGGQA